MFGFEVGNYSCAAAFSFALRCNGKADFVNVVAKVDAFFGVLFQLIKQVFILAFQRNEFSLKDVSFHG
jgi:hypothetical protein